MAIAIRSGTLFFAGERPWPALIQERLSDGRAEPVVVDNWRWAVYRPGAAEYALKLVEEARPDVVIVTLAAFWCAFATVQIRVEQRFGQRAANLYRRLERTTTRVAEQSDRPGKHTNTLARRTARKLIGMGTLMSVESFVDTAGEVIRKLSQDENLQVLVVAGHHYTADVRRAMPGLEPALQQIRAALRPVVEERRLVWADAEDALRAGGDREHMILGDGIHMTEEAHRRVADALEPVLRKMLERVAAPV